MLIAPTLSDALSRYLFEDPAYLVIALVLVWAGMRLVGRRKEQSRLLPASWGVLVLAGVVVGVSMMVQTPREKLEQTIDRLMLVVEQGDVQGFHAIVPEDAKATYGPVTANRAWVDERLDEADLEDVTLVSQEIDMSNDQRAVTYIRVRATGGAGFLNLSDWTITWEQRGGQWQAVRFVHEGDATGNLFGDPRGE